MDQDKQKVCLIFSIEKESRKCLFCVLRKNCGCADGFWKEISFYILI
jgi:hypothetical protein